MYTKKTETVPLDPKFLPDEVITEEELGAKLADIPVVVYVGNGSSIIEDVDGNKIDYVSMNSDSFVIYASENNENVVFYPVFTVEHEDMEYGWYYEIGVIGQDGTLRKYRTDYS